MLRTLLIMSREIDVTIDRAVEWCVELGMLEADFSRAPLLGGLEDEKKEPRCHGQRGLKHVSNVRTQ